MVITMPEDDSKDNQNDDEDWTSYANTGFGSTDYSLWDDANESETLPEPDWDDDYELQMNEEVVPSAPSPAGLKHLVKIGTCNHCLGRVSGKKRFSQTILESGIEVRNQVVEADPSLENIRDVESLCPFCENLTLTVDLDVRSQYFYGRYRKLERGIPQTKWPCKSCKGRGCEKCDFTGMQYTSSVQGLIGDPLLEKFGSEEHSFHGMGREDIDVRCLGRGRPFVIEFKDPTFRNIDCTEMMEIINTNAEGRLEVSSMRPSNRSEVVRVKDTPAEKSYTIRYKIEPMTQDELDELTKILEVPKDNRHRNSRRKKYYSKKNYREEKEPEEVDYSGLKKAELVAICEEKGLAKSGTKDVLIERIQNAKEETLPLPDKDFVLEIMEKLQGCTLAQRTPERVAHRRADKIRKRKVIETRDPSIEIVDDNLMIGEFSLRCESGTYVKETVHGDGGRTQPSIASLIKAKCTVEWLDVADIHAD